ncbi:DUF4817 domain-containing protein [Trichonephila clavipes]|nr:DUF4817 domain-containing protein [Trichonephila clavipes]
MRKIGGWSISGEFNVKDWDFQKAIELNNIDYDTTSMFIWSINLDLKNTTRSILAVNQHELTLNSRDNYLNKTMDDKVRNQNQFDLYSFLLFREGLVESFFKNDEGHNVTVNGDRYRAMITNFFIPELNNHDVQELWFRQDGATCHTARATIDLLKDTFVDRLMSRFGPVNSPPRSCDLTPLDYFLWGYVKSLFHADRPQTLDHLDDNIRRVIADIRPQMLEKVIENWTSSLDYIRASRGSPMPEIIFKM